MNHRAIPPHIKDEKIKSAVRFIQPMYQDLMLMDCNLLDMQPEVNIFTHPKGSKT
jgi:hypothetical protein